MLSFRICLSFVPNFNVRVKKKYRYTLSDLELCVGDFMLDLAELYVALISDMTLLSSLGATVSQAVEY